jgi:hypothetical protein
VNALQKLDPASGAGAAVKAVVLIGDPMHLPGKKSNVDQNGGSATDSARGIEAALPGAGLPAAWDNSGKVMDICFVVNSPACCRSVHEAETPRRATAYAAARRLRSNTWYGRHCLGHRV